MIEARRGSVKKSSVRLRFRWKKFIRFLFFLTLVIIFFEVGWVFIANLFQKVVAADWGVVEKGRWMDGLYLREEQLITAPAAGRLILKVKTGMRIPRDEVIALLDTQERFADQASNPADSSLQRYKRFLKLSREEAALRLDLQRIEDDFAKRQAALQPQNSQLDLDLLKQEKEQVLRTIQWISPQLMQIRLEISPILSRARYITATEAGCYSMETDGYENVLKPDYFNQLTWKDFRRNYALKKPGNHVKTGEVIGKLINPFNQIMALKVDLRQCDSPQPGTVWRFKTESGWKNATIIYLNKLNHRKAIAGVEIPSIEPDLTIPRTAKMFVVYQRITGVTVPVQAIVRKGGLAWVRVVKKKGYREKAVKVLGDDGSKAVVTGIDVGTMIISR